MAKRNLFKINLIMSWPCQTKGKERTDRSSQLRRHNRPRALQGRNAETLEELNRSAERGAEKVNGRFPSSKVLNVLC